MVACFQGINSIVCINKSKTKSNLEDGVAFAIEKYVLN